MTDQSFAEHTEEEITLIVCSDRPEKVLASIAALDGLAGLRFIPRGSVRLRDLHYDTPDRRLKRNRLGMRIRETSTGLLITVKGRTKVSSSGSITRSELELPWSLENLNRVLDRMRTAIPDLDAVDHAFSLTKPQQTLENMGLQLIQDRENYRTLRDVTPESGENENIVAEMVIDEVTYHFQDADIEHFEIEVEDKAGGTSDAPRRVAEALTALFPEDLRLRSWGKLPLGMALQDLLADGSLSGTIVDGRLKPEAYDILDKSLNSMPVM